MPDSHHLDLWDYRRRVADLYWSVRPAGSGEKAWTAWHKGRDVLGRHHPQSPLESVTRPDFGRLRYFSYDPGLRFDVPVRPLAAQDQILIGYSGAGESAFRRFGWAEIGFSGAIAGLAFYWLEGYGGGLFVPFGDLTNGDETYGGGRYVLDSAKVADLGGNGGRVIVDFNYAYHLSCVHSDRWSCPLAPAENRLPMAVRAGERL